MRRTILLIFLSLGGFFAQGCASTLTLKALPAPDQTYDIELTTPIIKSFKTNNVFIKILTKEYNHEEMPALYVIVGNFANEPFEFSTKNIKITSGGNSLQVYGLKEYKKLIQRRGAAMAFAVGLSAATASIAAATPSETYYQGTYRGRNFSGYAHTYNPAATAQAQASINANMMNQMMMINATQQISMMALDSMLQKALIKPGEIYGGVIRFEPPSFAYGEVKKLILEVKTPQDTHQFAFSVQVEKESED